MSNDTNTNLLEEANWYCDYWAGTLWEKLLDKAIKDNDLEYLAQLVGEARDEAFKQEYNPIKPREVF